MKVTPLELRQRQFTTVMRGYDRAEVNTFLAQAADDFEALMLENDRLRQEAGKAEAALNEHRGQEKQLSNTLLTAQKIADDIREKAQHDAARFISEAEGRIAMMVDKSQMRVGEVAREIEVLRAKRREVETSLENLVATLAKTLESVRDRDVQHEERNSLLLPTRDGDRRSNVVLPMKEPTVPFSPSGTSTLSTSTASTGSSPSITPAAPQPAMTPAGPLPAAPGPSVVVASTTVTPTTSAAPLNPTPAAPPSATGPGATPVSAAPTSAASPSPAPAPPASSSTPLTALVTPLVKPGAPPASPSSASSASSTSSASPARPSSEAQGARP